MSTANDTKLFSSVKYFTTGFRDRALETQFKQNGATRLFYLTEKTTHVICDDFENNKDELEQAIEIYQTPIVTSEWIRACLKSNSLVPTESYRSAEESAIELPPPRDQTRRLFQSCTFANANVITEDHNRLYALATYYGGRWIANLDSFICTHVICASPLSEKSKRDDTDERLQDAYEIQSDRVHLVTPDWIIDSIMADLLLKESDYHPDRLKQSDDSMDVDDDDEFDVRERFRSTDDRTSTKKDSSEMRSFASKRSASGATLSRTTIAPPIQKTNSVSHNAAVLSSTHRDSNESTITFDEKLIRPSISANLAEYKSHLQVSRHVAPESLSYELNYSLQDKHDRIPPSQCLLGCVIYIDEQEYLSTIPKDDLSSWCQTIRKHGAIVTDDLNHLGLTHFVCAYRTSESFRKVFKRGNVRMVTAHWLNDVLQRRKLFVPNLAIHYPALYSPSEPLKLPLAKNFMTITGFEGIERARLRYMIRSLGGKYSGHLSRWHTHLIARESGTSEKYIKALDWSIPIVNGLWLSELYLGNTNTLKQPVEDRFRRLSGTPTIDHFSFDQSFVHELLLSWSKPIRLSDETLNQAIRLHSHETNLLNNNESEINSDFSKDSSIIRSSSMSKMKSTPNGPLLVMLSGFSAKMLNYYEGIIKTLGGKISTLPHYTTHLIMNKFLRTEKLYECMGHVSYVLNKRWLDRCHESKSFVPVEESDWLIDDELKPPRNLLRQSIEKRFHRKNKPLFTGYTFYLTPSVQPSIITLKSIIFSAGGNVRRQFPTIKQLTTFDEQTKIPNCLILTCDLDKVLLKDLHKHNQTDFEIKFLSIDFVLESIVQQEILKIDSYVMKV